MNLASRDGRTIICFWLSAEAPAAARPIRTHPVTTTHDPRERCFRPPTPFMALPWGCMTDSSLHVEAAGNSTEPRTDPSRISGVQTPLLKYGVDTPFVNTVRERGPR